MKSIVFLLMALVLVSGQTIFPQAQPHHPRSHLWSAQEHQALIIRHLHQQLQTLNPHYLDNFANFFHSVDNHEVKQELATAQNGTYFLLLAKMYLYRLLDNPKQPQLQRYVTPAHLLAAYFYLKIAAERHGNDQAYYLLGLLEQFKLVPDKLIETNLANTTRTRDQQILYRHLKFSHLNNAEHMLYISAALGYDPAALVLGHMNRQPFGTPQNCTAALVYYLAVLKRNLFNMYVPKLVFEVRDSLEDELFARRRLESEQERKGHEFVVETGYFDQETISATLEQANRYYTGSGGVMRDLANSLRLFEKLAQQGNTDGKIMAGLMYFRGEGTHRDVHKAKRYFEQASKDEVSEYMLLAMQYFEIIQPKTREKAILTMKNKIAKRSKLSHLMEFLIGSAALKGEIKEVTQEQAIQMIDRSAAEGNPSARLLMAILFADGAIGLKYGCSESTKYLSDDALSHPYFRHRVNTAQVAIKKGEYAFAFFKYFQLIFNNYPTAFVNTLYLIEMYPSQTLRITQQSWLPSIFSKSQSYIALRKLHLVPDVTSFLLSQFTPVGLKPIKMNQLDALMTAGTNYVNIITKYMMNKIVKRGVIQEKRGILKYYEYKLLIEQGGDFQPLQSILSTLASGDSTKMYVSQARYLLGKLYHSRALRNKTMMTSQQSLKVKGEYNRAVKSQILGNLIYEIEQYRLTGLFALNFAQSDLGQDLLSYVFVLSISLFTLYYLRSKRFDHFHKIELEKQVRKAQEQLHQQQIIQAQNKQPEPQQPSDPQFEKKNQEDPDQPVIVEDPAPEDQYPRGGVRIGSSADDDLN